MRQKQSRAANSRQVHALSVFLTDLGWFGLVGHEGTALALTIGHASPDAVRRALSPPASFPASASSFPGSAWERTPATLRVASRAATARSHAATHSVAPTRSQAEPGNEIHMVESDWAPELRRRLEAFARGERCDFDDCPLALPALTPFQERVVHETRRIGWGSRLTYGELAARAGAPRAARAVGSVMAANRLPLLIPCHRVVASSGGLGGYSAPQGIELKRRLLALEAEGRMTNPE